MGPTGLGRRQKDLYIERLGGQSAPNLANGRKAVDSPQTGHRRHRAYLSDERIFVRGSKRLPGQIGDNSCDGQTWNH